jgi:hypothetical protein
MFEFRPNAFQFDLPDKPEYQDSAVLIQRTVNLFNTSRWKAIIEETKNFLFRLDHSLLDLSEFFTYQIHSHHHGGIKPVSIEKIRGTLGRSADFDRHFHPLSDRIRDRWVGVAIARLQNFPLPPVSLIQIRD